jgi:hypothetical protein
MTDRNAMPGDARSAADWLHHAAEVLRRIAHDATPGPWRWGDPAATIGVLERQRTTLERSPMNTTFPAVRRRDDDGEPVLPGLRDPLDLFEEAVDATSPRVHANARWITVLTPSIAEPLASLLEALARNAEQIIDAGGSLDKEPYLSALVLAKRIVEAAEDRPRP